MKKIFVLTYNPKETSDKSIYIDAYIQEAKNAGNEVKVLNIHDINIEYLEFAGNEPDLTLSEKLKQAQDNIIWADQLVIIYSVWCLGLPAKFKAFVERVFQKDILVRYGKMGPEPILKNKTAVIIQSYSMPYAAMKYIYNDIPFKVIKVIFSNWCGFKIEKRFDFDMIDIADEKRRQKWLKEIKKFAARIK